MHRHLLPCLAGLLCAAAACAPPPERTPKPDAPPSAVAPERLALADFVAPDRPGGTIVVGVADEPETLYVHAPPSAAAAHVYGAIGDGPFDRFTGGDQPAILEALPEPAPGAATRVTVRPGERYVADAASGRVITATAVLTGLVQWSLRFTIRAGVTWEDGAVLGADDALWSASLACAGAAAPAPPICRRTAACVKVDERTVEWRGLPGDAPPDARAAFHPPLPRHQTGSTGRRMDEMTPAEIARDPEFARRPLSYGPFRIEAWQAGERISLVRNPRYWRASEGLPFLDAVELRFVGETIGLAALQRGELDVLVRDAVGIVPSGELEQAARAGRLQLHAAAGEAWERILFDLDPLDGRAPLAACRDVRLALTLATDRDAMAGEVAGDAARVRHGFLPEWHPGAAGAAIVHPFDPELAKRKLEDLGFVDADGDGFREAAADITCTVNDRDGVPQERTIAAGTPLALRLLAAEADATSERVTLRFRENMKDIGVRIAVEFIPRAALTAQGAGAVLALRRYDLAETAPAIAGAAPADAFLCSAIPAADNGWSGANTTAWCDPEFDRAARLDAPARAQAIFAAALPVIPLFSRVPVTVASPRVILNFRSDAAGDSETWNIETWGFSQ